LPGTERLFWPGGNRYERYVENSPLRNRSRTETWDTALGPELCMCGVSAYVGVEQCVKRCYFSVLYYLHGSEPTIYTALTPFTPLLHRFHRFWHLLRKTPEYTGGCVQGVYTGVPKVGCTWVYTGVNGVKGLKTPVTPHVKDKPAVKHA